MDVLVDTGPLLRLVIRSDPSHFEVRTAIRLLRLRKDKLITLTQNIAEFWNVSTRPIAARGGYGFSVAETARKLQLLERLIEVRPESREAFQEWKRLVVDRSILGVKVYDARIVAAMTHYGITHLLTLNKADFIRYKGITVLEPRDVT